MQEVQEPKITGISGLLKYAVFMLFVICLLYSVAVLMYAGENPYFAEYYSLKISHYCLLIISLEKI